MGTDAVHRLQEAPTALPRMPQMPSEMGESGEGVIQEWETEGDSRFYTGWATIYQSGSWSKI